MGICTRCLNDHSSFPCPNPVATNQELEARVERLEGIIEDLREQLSTLQEQLSELGPKCKCRECS